MSSTAFKSVAVSSAPAPALRGGGNSVAKRALDASVAGAGLVLLAPIFALVALAVRLDSHGPVLFRQKRVGQGGRVFTLLKFRTMRWGTPDMATSDMQKQAQSPITTVGAVLRRTSLDELPQLVNVLKGEMSLVGPRPALPSQTRLNALRDARGVHDLRPGITGWAQVNGRDELSDDEKADRDAFYRCHAGLMLDLRILARTFLPHVHGRGNK